MKALVWVVAISVLAAGLVVAARYNPGYVLLVVPPYRVEISLNLLLVLLSIAFVLGYVLVRAVSGTVHLPARVREYRAARRRQRVQATLLDALRDFFAARYMRAEKAAVKLIGLGEHAGLCAVLAARAAHALRAFDRRDAYLAQGAKAGAEDDAVRVMTQAELLLDERRFQEALDALRALPRRHTAALRLELKAQQLAKNWGEVLVLVDQLERRNVFDAGQAEQIRRYAHAESLKRSGGDSLLLEEAWQKIPSRYRKDARIAAAAARCFIALGACGRAEEIIGRSLDAAWDSELAGLYGECTDGGDILKRIERAEAWLKQHPGDAFLLQTLGRLCVLQELWGKAQSYLEASLSIEPTCNAHLVLAQLSEKLGNADAAREHYRQSLDLALSELERSRDGRYKAPL